MEVRLGDGLGFIEMPNGGFLTAVNPGPTNIDVKSLDTDSKIKLISLLMKKVLIPTKNKEAEVDVAFLQEFVDNMKKQEEEIKEVDAVVQQVVQEEKQSSFEDSVEELRISARRLLKKTMNVIKAEARKLTPRELEILITEEKQWKNRKSLVPALEEMLRNLRMVVPTGLSGLTRDDEDELQRSIEVMQRKEVHPMYAGLVGPVVEEEEEQVIIKYSDNKVEDEEE